MTYSSLTEVCSLLWSAPKKGKNPTNPSQTQHPPLLLLFHRGSQYGSYTTPCQFFVLATMGNVLLV